MLSWGDWEYGKLGRGDSDGFKVPGLVGGWIHAHNSNTLFC